MLGRRVTRFVRDWVIFFVVIMGSSKILHAVNPDPGPSVEVLVVATSAAVASAILEIIKWMRRGRTGP